MTVILFVTKTDTLLQGLDVCNQSGEINRLPLKEANPLERSSKEVAALDKKLLSKMIYSKQTLNKMGDCNCFLKKIPLYERIDGSS